MQGIIKSILARNQIELLKHSGLATENVPNTELTLREIVRVQSVWLPHVRLQRPLPRKKVFMFSCRPTLQQCMPQPYEKLESGLVTCRPTFSYSKVVRLSGQNNELMLRVSLVEKLLRACCLSM